MLSNIELMYCMIEVRSLKTTVSENTVQMTTFGHFLYGLHHFYGHFCNQRGQLPHIKGPTQLVYPKPKLESTKTQLNQQV